MRDRRSPAELLQGIFLARPERDPGGIRLAVKDLFDTAGLETTYGSALFIGHVPDRSAGAVALLEAAGYGVVGKTNLHEFAFGTTSENPHFGAVPNPAAPGRVAGGSSGGNAAALAAGLADVALGSDTGGSIRIPAACCGTVGFKPTFGLVPLDGCFPLAPTFDHAGPMARTVDECAAAMQALAPGLAASALESLEEIEVGVWGTAEAEPLVRARVEAAAALFPRRRAIVLPELAASAWAVFLREVADVHRELFAENAELYGEDLRIKIERCLAVPDSAVEEGLRALADYRAAMPEALGDADLLLSPTLPCVAPRLGEGAPGDINVRERLVHFTRGFNALGWPALALPCGAAEDGLPASVQLAGRVGADPLVLAAGALLERTLAA